MSTATSVKNHARAVAKTASKSVKEARVYNHEMQLIETSRPAKPPQTNANTDVKDGGPAHIHRWYKADHR